MGTEDIVIALAALAWLLWRQLQVRELRRDRGMILPLVLVVAGVAEIASYGHDHPLHATQRASLNERARRRPGPPHPLPAGPS